MCVQRFSLCCEDRRLPGWKVLVGVISHLDSGGSIVRVAAVPLSLLAPSSDLVLLYCYFHSCYVGVGLPAWGGGWDQTSPRTYFQADHGWEILSPGFPGWIVIAPCLCTHQGSLGRPWQIEGRERCSSSLMSFSGAVHALPYLLFPSRHS